MAEPKRWWKYAVLRGDGIPVHLDGVWYDLAGMAEAPAFIDTPHATFHATNRWEQRDDDGEIAVVYEMPRTPEMTNIHINQAQMYTPKAGDVIVIETPPASPEKLEQLQRMAEAVFGHDVRIAVLGGANLAGVVRKEEGS